jgi:hypothetical protein
LVTVLPLATAYLGLWIFLCVTVKPSHQPILFATVVWVLCVKVAFARAVALQARAADMTASVFSQRIACVAVGFLVAAILFAGSALAGERTLSVLWVPYAFLGVALLMMARTARADASNKAAPGDGHDGGAR